MRITTLILTLLLLSCTDAQPPVDVPDDYIPQLDDPELTTFGSLPDTVRDDVRRYIAQPVQHAVEYNEYDLPVDPHAQRARDTAIALAERCDCLELIAPVFARSGHVRGTTAFVRRGLVQTMTDDQITAHLDTLITLQARQEAAILNLGPALAAQQMNFSAGFAISQAPGVINGDHINIELRSLRLYLDTTPTERADYRQRIAAWTQGR